MSKQIQKTVVGDIAVLIFERDNEQEMPYAVQVDRISENTGLLVKALETIEVLWLSDALELANDCIQDARDGDYS